MYDRNAKSECTLIKLWHNVHLFLNLSAKELPISMKKYYLIAEVLIYKYRWQNISVSNTALLTAVTYPEVTLCSENGFYILAIGDGVGCCEQSGAYRLVLHWSIIYRGERLVLSRCLASSTVSASHSGDFFTFQQGNAPAHRARETVQPLTCETPDFIAPALWPANSPDLNPVDYQTRGSIAVGCMTLTSWSHVKSGNISIRYSSMKRPGNGVHFFELAFEHTEDILNTGFSYVWYLYRRTLWRNPAIVDTIVLGWPH